MIIDSHAHITYEGLVEDVDNIVNSAKNAGVSVIQTISTKSSEFEKVKLMANRFEIVYCSIGIHPHEVENEKNFDELALEREASSHNKIIGIGETGLDYYYKNSAATVQQKFFDFHANVAKKLDMPIIVHTREAEEDTYSIIKNHSINSELKGLIHCFTSSIEFARKMLDLGFYISLSGIVTFKNAIALQDVAKFIPNDRLIIETDAPFLAPVPMRGKINKPEYIVHTLNFLAELRNTNVEKLANITSDNFFRLFTKNISKDNFNIQKN
jgi:TatD DNase family protein